MKNSFLIYHEYKEHFDLLSDEELGQLLRAVMDYEITDTAPEFQNGLLKMAFSFMKNTLDRDKKKWTDKCEKNKESARKRWDSENANAYKRIQTHNEKCERKKRNANHADNVNDNDSDNVNESDKDISPPTPPSGGAGKKIKSDLKPVWDKYNFSQNVREIMLQWVNYKTEKNQKYKPTGFNSLLSQLDKAVKEYGEQAVINLIGKCMANNWQGIAWDKLLYKGGSNGRNQEDNRGSDGEGEKYGMRF